MEAKSSTEIDNSECSTLAYIGIALTLISMVIVILLHYRKSKFCRGYRFSNVVKIVLFISDVQHYIPIKLCKASGSSHLFKIKGTLKSEVIRLNKNYLWDMLEINWNKIKLLLNSNEIELPQIITIKMQDKIRMISKEMQNFHIMIKQGINMVQLRNRNRNSINLQILHLDMACLLQPECNFLHRFFRCKLLVEVVDVEVKITSMQEMHIFIRDRMTQLIKCTPWSMRLCPHPTIIKKMKTFLEVENKMGLIPIPAPANQYRPPLPETNPNVKKNDMTEKRKELHPRRSLGQPPPKLPQCIFPCQKPHQSPRVVHHQYW